MDEKMKRTALSVAGGVAVLGVGYLIWRHEQTVQAINAQQQQAQNAAQEADYAQQLMSALSQSVPSGMSGGGASGNVNDTGNVAAIEPSSSNTDLEQILSAFFGSQTGTGKGTATTPPPSSGAGQPPPDNTTSGVPGSGIGYGASGTYDPWANPTGPLDVQGAVALGAVGPTPGTTWGYPLGGNPQPVGPEPVTNYPVGAPVSGTLPRPIAIPIRYGGVQGALQ